MNLGLRERLEKVAPSVCSMLPSIRFIIRVSENVDTIALFFDEVGHAQTAVDFSITRHNVIPVLFRNDICVAEHARIPGSVIVNTGPRDGRDVYVVEVV